MTPVTPKTSGAIGRRRAASRPNGMPSAQLAASAANTGPTCSSASRPRSAQKSLPKRRPLRGVRRGRRASSLCLPRAQPGRGDGSKVLAVEFGGGIQAPRRRVVETPFELRERRPRLRKPRWHSRAIQQHGVVSREEPDVVGEDGQVVLVELGVSRVDVDHVDLAAGNCLIGEPMVKARGRWGTSVRRRAADWANHRRGQGTPATARAATGGAV